MRRGRTGVWAIVVRTLFGLAAGCVVLRVVTTVEDVVLDGDSQWGSAVACPAALVLGSLRHFAPLWLADPCLACGSFRLVTLVPVFWKDAASVDIVGPNCWERKHVSTVLMDLYCFVYIFFILLLGNYGTVRRKRGILSDCMREPATDATSPRHRVANA